MKIKCFNLKQGMEKDLINFFIEKEYQEKTEEELRDKVLRLGFAPYNAYLTCPTVVLYKDERILNSKVKDRLLNHPEVKSLLSKAPKKEQKLIKEEIIHKAKLKSPWGQSKCRIAIFNSMVFIMNGFKEAEEAISEFLDGQVVFDVAAVVKGANEDTYTIDPLRGSHCYAVAEDKFSVKGEPVFPTESDVSKVTAIFTTSLDSMTLTVTSESLSVNDSEFKGSIQSDDINEIINLAISRLYDMVVSKIMRIELPD